MCDDDFKLVTYKKGKKSNKINQPTNFYHQQIDLDPNIVIKRIEEAKREILTSDLYDSILASLHEGFLILNQPIVKEIICFGLGRICDCLIARYQFALLLLLKEYYNNIDVYCYDPIFTNLDQQIIEHYNCKLLKTNCEEMASKKVNTLRQIISELRLALPKQSFNQNNPTLQYLFKQYKKYQTTTEQLCKAKEEMDFIANTYLCYLKSIRLQQQIHDEFHGKGERSVEETAKLVGFKLPHDPK